MSRLISTLCFLLICLSLVEGTLRAAPITGGTGPGGIGTTNGAPALAGG